MQREIIKVQVDRPKRRHDFLFHDGEFKPRKEKLEKIYRRQQKHRNVGDYADRFYR